MTFCARLSRLYNNQFFQNAFPIVGIGSFLEHKEEQVDHKSKLRTLSQNDPKFSRCSLMPPRMLLTVDEIFFPTGITKVTFKASPSRQIPLLAILTIIP